ncbi:MTH938/NDUFAF3 family protein [Parasphingopyxis marina]|uniref:Mth938-like domain-containing protein n=1 Tax=Parasphingopyxis marina TaxID=2761622 RepID=A0A842I289_9SPHN|nr:MTH938/NDUFAF3 family protein [Parasphingopyxis marina]MBC2778819.1 Mth938-like domain-containing protein [Parasphingopyxis marina]
MVSLNREAEGPGPIINGFAGTGFRIGEEVFERGLWLTPQWARGWDGDGLDDAALAPLFAIDPLPEFLLLGTGEALVRPDPDFVAAVEARNIGVEAMDSRAAARSWGLLRNEGRWIVAALMPLG